MLRNSHETFSDNIVWNPNVAIQNLTENSINNKKLKKSVTNQSKHQLNLSVNATQKANINVIDIDNMI